MLNLGALAPITTAAQALSNLVLVTPETVKGYQPQNPTSDEGAPSTKPPPPALLFHYEATNRITLQSDITDHYVEDNSAVQDQIALRPERVTAKGYIGELNNVPPLGLQTIKAAAEKLTAIDAYAPQISATASLAYAQAFFLYQSAQNVANTAVSAWSTLNGALGGATANVVDSNGIKVAQNQNKQQVMFQQFYGYWRSRTLFTVQTPWAVFQNMAIEELTAEQDEDSKEITSFDVRFKMIRNAKTLMRTGTSLTMLDGRAASQASGLTDLGTSSPVKSINVSSGLSSMGLA